MTEDKKADNMKLWEQVCTTDPAITKKINVRGGFTAIAAQAQIKRATELWGPYGGKWGVKNCTHTHLFETEGRKISEVMLTGIFYYPDGEFEIATDIKFVVGGDSAKKLLTDLTTKALSKLGFNSDVFEGKFDDNKYVESLKNGNLQPESITKDQIEIIGQLMEETETKPNDKKLILYLKNTFGEVEIINLNSGQAKKLEATLQTKLDIQNTESVKEVK